MTMLLCESKKTIVEMANETLKLLRRSSNLHEDSQVNGTFLVKLGLLLFGSQIIKYRRPICDTEMISNINDVIQQVSSVVGVTLDHIRPEAVYRGKPLAVKNLMEVMYTFVVYCTQADLLDFDMHESTTSGESYEGRQSKKCENVESYLPTSPELPRSAGRPNVLNSLHRRKAFDHTNSGDKNQTGCEPVFSASRTDVLYPVPSACSRETLTPCGNIYNRHLARLHSADSPPTTPQATHDILELDRDHSEGQSFASLQSSPVFNSPIYQSNEVTPQRKVDLAGTNNLLSGQQMSPGVKTSRPTVCTSHSASPPDLNRKTSYVSSSGRGHSLTFDTHPATMPTDHLLPRLSTSPMQKAGVYSERSSADAINAQLSWQNARGPRSSPKTGQTDCPDQTAIARSGAGARNRTSSSSSGRGRSPTTTTCTVTMPTDKPLPPTQRFEQQDSVISGDDTSSAAELSTVSGSEVLGDAGDDDTRTSSILAWSCGVDALSQPTDCNRQPPTFRSDLAGSDVSPRSTWAAEANWRPSSCPGRYQSVAGPSQWEHRYGSAISTASVLLARTESYSLALKRRLSRLRSVFDRTREEADAVSRLVSSLVPSRGNPPPAGDQSATEAMLRVVQDQLQEVLRGVHSLLSQQQQQQQQHDHHRHESQAPAWEAEYRELMRTRDQLMLDALSVLETVLKTQQPPSGSLKPVAEQSVSGMLRSVELTALQIGA